MDPASQTRRSFVYRQLAAAGAAFDAIADGALAVHFGDAASEAETARRMGLADLSVLPRGGFKGPGTSEWLAGQGLTLPAVNEAAAQAQGGLAARLGPEEVLVLGGLDGADDLVSRLGEAWASGPAGTARGSPVPRRDSQAWFVVTGEHAAEMFAKLCAVDLRPRTFSNHRVAQTSAARANGIVIRADVGDTLAFHLLVDSAMAEYYLSVLQDAMSEFGGSLIGFAALQALLEAAP